MAEDCKSKSKEYGGLTPLQKAGNVKKPQAKSNKNHSTYLGRNKKFKENLDAVFDYKKKK